MGFSIGFYISLKNVYIFSDGVLGKQDNCLPVCKREGGPVYKLSAYRYKHDVPQKLQSHIDNDKELL